MKTHSAGPDLKYLERMLHVIQRLVEEHVAQPPAQNDAEHAIEQHVVDVARMPARQQIAARANLPEPHEEHERKQVHETVPAHGDGTDLERNGIEIWVDQHRAACRVL